MEKGNYYIGKYNILMHEGLETLNNDKCLKFLFCYVNTSFFTKNIQNFSIHLHIYYHLLTMSLYYWDNPTIYFGYGVIHEIGRLSI